MFREMRRKVQQLSEEECVSILQTCTNGILSVNGDDGYPYGVPVSYAYHDGKIYIHGAKTGHKIESIRKDNKVCFTVVERDDIIPEKYTTAYRSVIVFARAREVTEQSEIIEVLTHIGTRYNKDDEEGLNREIEMFLRTVSCLELTIEHMTGKQGKELLRKKR